MTDAPVATDRYFEPDAETMPRDRLEALQEEKLLGDLLPWAYARSPLVRSTWDAAGVTIDDVKTMDDFREKVPFVDKDAIRRFRDVGGDRYGGLLCVDPLRAGGPFTAVFSTSGTTGDPTLVPSGAAMERLLGVFELEKAVYELRYELNNRPDWVAIPVAGIVRMLGESVPA